MEDDHLWLLAGPPHASVVSPDAVHRRDVASNDSHPETVVRPSEWRRARALGKTRVEPRREDQIVEKEDQVVEKAEPQKDPVPSPASVFDAWVVFGNGSLDAFVKVNSAALRGCEALSTELLSVAMGQLDDGWRMGEAVVKCRSPKELSELQSEYLRSASERCRDTAQRLGEIAGTAVSEAWTPFFERATAMAGVFRRVPGT